jgi:hypothetical protein
MKSKNSEREAGAKMADLAQARRCYHRLSHPKRDLAAQNAFKKTAFLML